MLLRVYLKWENRKDNACSAKERPMGGVRRIIFIPLHIIHQYFILLFSSVSFPSCSTVPGSNQKGLHYCGGV